MVSRNIEMINNTKGFNTGRNPIRIQCGRYNAWVILKDLIQAVIL
jgi:hypothetical protein